MTVAHDNVVAHWRLAQCMYWHEAPDERGEFWMLMLNVLQACALEAVKREGRRTGAMHVNASAVSLIKRLTRALDYATCPFDSTDESRAMQRVEWELA